LPGDGDAEHGTSALSSHGEQSERFVRQEIGIWTLDVLHQPGANRDPPVQCLRL
jgi:hypothetical protein